MNTWVDVSYLYKVLSQSIQNFSSLFTDSKTHTYKNMTSLVEVPCVLSCVIKKTFILEAGSSHQNCIWQKNVWNSLSAVDSTIRSSFERKRTVEIQTVLVLICLTISANIIWMGFTVVLLSTLNL